MRNHLIAASIFAVGIVSPIYAIANPVAEFYPDGYPAWTDNIEWSNVINMATDSRVTSIQGEWARYEKGVELLGEKGGVLYYPAGVYKFTDLPAGENGAKPDGEGLMLRSGVVLLGDKPKTSAYASDLEGGIMDLPTVFEFPLYDRNLVGANDEPMVKQTAGHWNFVGLKTRPNQELKDVDNVGICFINFKNAGVYWGAQYEWAESYQGADRQSYGAAGCDADKGWMPTRVADGTHYADPFSGCKKVSMIDPLNGNNEDGTNYIGSGSGRLILGCRFDNAVLLDAGGYKGEYSDGENGGDKREFEGLALDPYRFGARVTIDASNVFIGSTAITKPTNAFLYKNWLQMPNGDPVNGRDNKQMMLNVPQLFDPAKHVGFDIGKGILGLVTKAQRHSLDDYSCFYEPNIIVRDCYVYNHGHKGYEISGRWVKVLNNVNDRDFLSGGTIPEPSSPNKIDHIGDAKEVYGLTDKISYKIRSGKSTVTVEGEEGHYIARLSSLRGTNQSDDNMSRAFDMGGHNVWIDGNSFWNTGSWPGNDGEGILGQRSGEIEAFSWATTNNEAIITKSNPWPKSGYMATYDMHTIGALWYGNKGEHPEWSAGVWARMNNDKAEEVAVINNVNGNGEPGSGDFIDSKNTGTVGPLWKTSNAPVSGIKAPTDVKAVLNEKEGYVEISWNPDYTIDGDVVVDNSNEVGYRVERRKEGKDDWTVIAYRPLQNGYKVLEGVNRSYKGKNNWTLDEMDLNPPVWRDYEKIEGTAEYRVVALGLDSSLDMPQIEEPIKIVFTSTTGVENIISKNDLNINYNPVSQDINISDFVDSVEVINQAGLRLKQASKVSSLSLSELPAGVYVIKVEKNGVSKTVQILKK